MSVADTHAALTARIGETLKTSDWVMVDQERINAFADATGDHQWIHVDPERAKKESPFGATIAHGFLTLSLCPMLRDLVNPDNPAYPGTSNIINYGLNKLRFPNAVRSGTRVRGHFVLKEVEQKGESLQVTESYTIEVENEAKPALIAEGIMRLYFQG